MSEIGLVFAISVLVLGCATPQPLPDAGVSMTEQETFLKDWEAWRAGREQSLRDPDGWLTLIGLFWLDDGEQRMGAAPDNEIILESASSPPLLGHIHLTRDGEKMTVRFVAAPGESVLLEDGASVTEASLVPDAEGPATVLRHKSITMHVIKRGDRLALRVKDSESPVLKDFGGVSYFPASPKWQIKASLAAHAAPQMLNVPTAIGTVEPQPSPGVLSFEVEGQRVELHPVGDPGDTSLFVIFADATSGQETYGAGRFLTAEKTPDGLFLLDFNRAYNPPCAFTPYATCPRPPAENRLKVAIQAGEKAPK